VDSPFPPFNKSLNTAGGKGCHPFLPNHLLSSPPLLCCVDLSFFFFKLYMQRFYLLGGHSFSYISFSRLEIFTFPIVFCEVLHGFFIGFSLFCSIPSSLRVYRNRKEAAMIAPATLRLMSLSPPPALAVIFPIKGVFLVPTVFRRILPSLLIFSTYGT